MDKQNISRIPVNTRTVGTPSGIYILYLEDYVHTFVKKFQSGEAELALFGRRYEEEGRSILVVSGAAEQPFSEEKGRQYFPDCAFLGIARAQRNKEEGLRLELSLKNTNVALDDFYIYYDQNEEMQTYLIEWNASHQAAEFGGDRAEQEGMRNNNRVRVETDEAVRYGRIAQAYNREEARVSFIWNVMNVLCLGFVVCVMAYGIISINNYHKMQDMQKTVDYCMALVTEKIRIEPRDAVPANATPSSMSNDMSNDTADNAADTAADTAEGETAQAKAPDAEAPVPASSAAQSPSVAPAAAERPGMENSDTINSDTLNSGTKNSDTKNSDTEAPGGAVSESGANLQQEGVQEAMAEAEPEAAEPSQNSGAESMPQYYVVRRGDTLRSICYQIYGDYSKVDEVCEWNKIENPDNILYGQRLLLP